jgi:hypothetical protein
MVGAAQVQPSNQWRERWNRSLKSKLVVQFVGLLLVFIHGLPQTKIRSLAATNIVVADSIFPSQISKKVFQRQKTQLFTAYFCSRW